MFKIETKGMLASFVFYTVAGIICLAVLPLSGFPPHLGIIGILSLLTAYGLIKKRVWTVWLVAMLFFVATTFSIFMLYYYFGVDLLLDISMITYLILTWIFTAYIATKKGMLES